MASIILSIETSTRNCSVALHTNNQLVAASHLLTEQSHSSMLTSLINNLLQVAAYQFKDIDAIALAKGPGSYTGLRIGTSTAKGLCFALDKPLLAVNTLEAMAYQFSMSLSEEALLCPMIDARRMEVYCAVFDKRLNYIENTQAKIIDETSFAELLLNNKIIFFGDGAAKCKSKLSASKNAFFVDKFYPGAESVGYLASEYYEQKKFEDPAYFEPYYLKDFVGVKIKY